MSELTLPAHKAPGPVHAFARRLHLCIGILVGPFVHVAALSGVLCTLTPQLKKRRYHKALRTPSEGPTFSSRIRQRTPAEDRSERMTSQ